MPSDLKLRVGTIEVPGTLIAAGADAKRLAATGEGARALLTGDRDYLVGLPADLPVASSEALRGAVGRLVLVTFTGRRPVRRRLASLGGLQAKVGALQLGEGLWLLPDGRLAPTAIAPASPAPADAPHLPAGDALAGMAVLDALVAAARWVSTRRTSTFERLFPPSAFHPDLPVRGERLSLEQGKVLLEQLRGALATARVGGEAARRDALAAAQMRSAALTVLSHLVATVLKDPGFRAIADAASDVIFALIDAEQGDPTAQPALRAHAIQLLQLRAPALQPAARQRAVALVRSLVRTSPPYDAPALQGTWRFAMCSAHEFHKGEVQILTNRYGWKQVPAPEGAPRAPGWGGEYTVLESPARNPSGQPIQVWARSASPSDENTEMGSDYFVGLLINRHAQLGAFDMRAASVTVRQSGYKLMMNSQCAGLTTRFALSRMFPDADIYSSWDSTYFHEGADGIVTSSEGLDCFVALLDGMARGETHAQLADRMRRAQWTHPQARAVRDFHQFVGPAHPLVVARFNDVNQDGKADLYDGFLDFTLEHIAEDVRASATPRDPGVAPSQVGGAAAEGLGWAVGSLNRVTQYSDIWAGLPGEAEYLYAFTAGGFYSHKAPPVDVPVAAGTVEELGRLPAVCRYAKTDAAGGGLQGEVMMHAHLAHAAKEYKRLLCAAEAFWRAVDLGHLPRTGPLATPAGQRGALLLTLAGLLEFPADQNNLDALWSQALKALGLPDISRSLVGRCITDADHNASNYYGSRRGLRQLVGEGGAPGELERADPVAWAIVKSDDPRVGRAQALGV